jgi:hypothetical protein
MLLCKSTVNGKQGFTFSSWFFFSDLKLLFVTNHGEVISLIHRIAQFLVCLSQRYENKTNCKLLRICSPIIDPKVFRKYVVIT